jgi:hypothetical protein
MRYDKHEIGMNAFILDSYVYLYSMLDVQRAIVYVKM